ncbi:MAG: phage tail sheath family protein [Chloroflexi bacterium]|nr:phage tail sheath family protein [Chloroflexota bacterium]
MPAVMKTPGVYIVEESAFPSSVVEVATAVPAFIGYTEKADNKGRSLSNRPWRITSLSEYLIYFGGPPHMVFNLIGLEPGEAAGPGATPALPPAPEATEEGEGSETSPEETPPALPPADLQTDAAPETAGFYFAGRGYELRPENAEYLLYYSMSLFFQNGGGSCYVVSVGSYSDALDIGRFEAGIGLLVKEQEPTMVLIPEAMRLGEADCITVQQAMLRHCGAQMKNRFAVLDIYNGFHDRQHPEPDGDPIDKFRSALGVNNLDFGAAYYPWVNTTIVRDSELSFDNISIDTQSLLQTLLRVELDLPEDGSVPEGRAAQQAEAVNEITKDWSEADSEGKVPSAEQVGAAKALLDKVLKGMSPQLYGSMLTEIKDKLNLLPPAAAIAGVYTAVDNARGVWKAPANVSLNAVVSPSVNITHDDQEDLNVTVQGKSINAIRPFIGEGVLVWGGRTLDGNSLDWRYIQVRRTMIMLEESIKLAAKAYVFENNNANTWVTIKSTIRNFLTGIWKRGGLAGASPDDAFAVFVGLGETMTPEDILEGILRVTVLVAITRPAEFIEITFQQQMQQS